VSDVKQSLAFLLTAAAFSAAGCSSLELARFAPPGIIKYEQIANKKPPNTAMQEIIDERREASEKKFPVLFETPSQKDIPTKRTVTEVTAEIEALEAARDYLAAAVEASRGQVEADSDKMSILPEQRDALSDKIERDEALAKDIRENPIPLPDDQ